MNVQEAVEEYLAAHRHRMKPKTLKETGRILSSFSAWCAGREMALESIRARTVDEFLECEKRTKKGKRGASLSSHTLYLHSTIIKAFLSWCAKDEDFEEYVPLARVKKIKPPKRDQFVIETFTKEQIESLLLACEKVETGSAKINTYLRDRDRAIVMLLLDTGIRTAELCGLQMKHICISPIDPHIKVFGKGDKWREIGLGERCRKELRRFVNKHRSHAVTDKHVFLTRRGAPIPVRALIGIIERLGEKAKIEGVRCSPHVFRHTYSVSFMRNGGDIYKLSKLMGHTSVRITENYLKSFNQQDARRGAISPLDNFK